MNVKKIVPGVLAVLLAAAFVGYCWSVRETPEARRAATKAAYKYMSKAKQDQFVAYLDALAQDRALRPTFDDAFPWLHLRYGTAVPLDTIAGLAENAITRCSGNGTPGSENVAVLKNLIAFAERLRPELDASSANSLRERCLDAYFLSGDIDGAIRMIDEGMPGRSANWCKGTAAKLRAHKAMNAKDAKEALKQLLVFGEYMASDEMKDFEDADPTTGIVYSREWVCARNFIRCATYAKELGDAAKAAEYRRKAADLFEKALVKAKENSEGDKDPSMKALKDEMKAAGL